MPPYATTELGHALTLLPAPRTHLATHPPNSDDDLLADILISMWALASGHFLRRGIRPDQLSEEELIDFWADDMTPAYGATWHGCQPTQQRPAETPETHVCLTAITQRRTICCTTGLLG